MLRDEYTPYDLSGTKESFSEIKADDAENTLKRPLTSAQKALSVIGVLLASSVAGIGAWEVIKSRSGREGTADQIPLLVVDKVNGEIIEITATPVATVPGRKIPTATRLPSGNIPVAPSPHWTEGKASSGEKLEAAGETQVFSPRELIKLGWKSESLASGYDGDLKIFSLTDSTGKYVVNVVQMSRGILEKLKETTKYDDIVIIYHVEFSDGRVSNLPEYRFSLTQAQDTARNIPDTGSPVELIYIPREYDDLFKGRVSGNIISPNAIPLKFDMKLYREAQDFVRDGFHFTILNSEYSDLDGDLLDGYKSEGVSGANDRSSHLSRMVGDFRQAHRYSQGRPERHMLNAQAKKSPKNVGVIS